LRIILIENANANDSHVDYRIYHGVVVYHIEGRGEFFNSLVSAERV